MLVMEVTLVNNPRCWQETYLGMPMSRSDAASAFLPATILEPFLTEALELLNVSETRAKG